MENKIQKRIRLKNENKDQKNKNRKGEKMKRKNITLDYYELERFLEYLNDKVEDVYRSETTSEINRRLQRLRDDQPFEE